MRMIIECRTSNGLKTAPEYSIDDRSDMDSSLDAGMMARSDPVVSDQEGLARAHAANGSSTDA